MSIFAYDDITCEWIPRKGLHVFERAGKFFAQVRSNAAWRPWMPNVRADGWLLPRFATVERTYRRRMLPHQLVGRGNLTDGGEQGGGDGIDDYFFGGMPPDLPRLDGVIERHPVAAFHWETGDPLTRADLLFDEPYTPLRNEPTAQVPYQLRPFTATIPASHPQARWQRYDPAHLIRAWGPATAAQGDPVARWWTIVVASDVMLAQSRERVAGHPTRLENSQGWAAGSAYSGEVRARAWELGTVVAAMPYLPTAREWVQDAVEFECNIQAPNGACTRGQHATDPFQSAPWNGPEAVGDDVEVETWWESCFMARMLYNAALALGDARSIARVREWVRRRRMILADVPPRADGGPPKFLIVARNNVLVDRITEGTYPGNNAYTGAFWDVAMRMGVV